MTRPHHDWRALVWDVRDYSKAAQAYLGISAHDLNAEYDQAHYRFAQDTGSESSPTWLADEDTDYSVQTSSDFTVLLRFKIAQTIAGADLLRSPSLKIMGSYNGGGWLSMAALNTYVAVHNSSVLTHGNDASNTLTAVYSGKFIPDNVGTSNSGQIDNGNDEMNAALNIATQDDNSEWEVVVALTIKASAMSGTVTLDFRLVHGANSDQTVGTALNAYSANGSQGYARVTRTEPPISRSYSTDFWEEMRSAVDTKSGVTPAVISGMTVTPGAGTYLVMFSGALHIGESGSEILTAAIFANDTEVSLSGPIYYTRSQQGSEGSLDYDDRRQLACAGVATVSAGQAIDVRWWSSSSTTVWDIYERRIILVKVTGTGIGASAAGSNSNSTSSTDFSASVCSLSSPPGDEGNYLVLFKTVSVNHATVEIGKEFRLYVGGSEVDVEGGSAFNERRLFEEDGSFPDTQFPHFSAFIVNVGASDSIDMRWARAGGTSETAEIDYSGLVVYGPFDDADWAQVGYDSQSSTAQISGSWQQVKDESTGNMQVSESAADDYIAVFSCVVDASQLPAASANKQEYCFFVNGTQDQYTVAVDSWEESWGADRQHSKWAMGKVSPGASQNVDIRYRASDQPSSGQIMQFKERHLLIFKPSSYTSGTQYTLTAEAGSYLWTGSAAGLEFNRLLAAGAGSYLWTGSAANLEFNRLLNAEAGAYTWTGSAAALLYNRLINAEAGSYTWAGSDANLEFNRIMAAGPGSYLWTGSDVTLSKSFRMTAEAGSYLWTGTAAGLLYDRLISAEAGSFLWTGTDANLEFNRQLLAEAGSYLWTGSDALLEYNRAIVAGAGSYLWTGSDVTLLYDRILTAGPGSYLWTGSDVTLIKGFRMVAESGSYIWTGTAAILEWNHRLTADPGAFIWTGTAAILTYNQLQLMALEDSLFRRVGSRVFGRVN